MIARMLLGKKLRELRRSHTPPLTQEEADFEDLLRYKQADAIKRKYDPDIIEMAYRAIEKLSKYPSDQVKEAISRVKAKRNRTEPDKEHKNTAMLGKKKLDISKSMSYCFFENLSQ